MSRLIPARGLLTVRPVQPEDSFAGSVIVVPDTAKARLTAWQWDVIEVGEPALCDARKCDRPHVQAPVGRLHPCDVRAGDWVVVRPRADVLLPDAEGVCVVSQDDVWAVLSA